MCILIKNHKKLMEAISWDRLWFIYEPGMIQCAEVCTGWNNVLVYIRDDTMCCKMY